jgi:germination protein M
MSSRPMLRVAAVATVLALVGCDKKGPPQLSHGDPVESLGGVGPTATASASETPHSTPSTTTSATPAGTMTSAVYYLGTDARLYRELRSVPRTSAVIRSAVDAMLHLAPNDPDYRSMWPRATTVRGVSVSGDVATVDLSGNARTGVSAGADAEQQSLQQLVHTVTAAAPSITGVKVRFDGRTQPTLWGHVDTTGTLRRRAQEDTLAPVWVVSPAQFAKVGRTLTVKGSASVFEATVSWSLRRLTGGQIASGSTNASIGAPGRGDWSVTVTVPASVTGEVVFKAWESSAEDGRELYPDDKRWKVG